MITDALMGTAAWMISGILSVLPTLPVPSWVGDGATMLENTLSIASQFGNWVPFTIMGVVLAALLGAVVVGFGVKVGRIVSSYLTAGGGSAG